MNGETENAKTADQPGVSAASPRSTARRDLLLSIVGFVLFVALSAGAVTLLNPPKKELAVPRDAYVSAQGALEITLAHTNDTWGYLEGCG